MNDEEVAQLEKTKNFIVQQQEMKLHMHQGSMAGQPSRAVATKSVGDVGGPIPIGHSTPDLHMGHF